jgi:signal transduction histidine kinase
MKRREALLALVAGAVVVLALLTVFAIELSNTQSRSKQDVKSRVHERAVIAAALLESLFQYGQQQLPQYERLYGTPTVSNRLLEQELPIEDSYQALLASDGHLIGAGGVLGARGGGVGAPTPAVLAVRSGAPYGVGNLEPYGRNGAIVYAVSFPTRYGTRVIVQGVSPSLLGFIITSDLFKIPGVRGAQNYLLDGNNAVLGTTNPAVATDRVLRPASTLGKGQYVTEVQLVNSHWRLILAAPSGPLFANVSGLNKWVPWAIFGAFALVALAALALGHRALRSTAQVRVAKDRLELVNGELARANSALEQRASEFARSNSDLEQFASIASHDLQEPLRKVRTFTQRVTLTEAANLSPKGHDYLQRANAAAARMQALIEDLLRFSRVATQQRRFTTVDLGQVTREVLIDLSDQVARSGAIVAIGDLPTVSGDPIQLRQLLQNLISNALKFRRDGVQHEVTIQAGGEEGMVELSVQDNGIGFDPEHRSRIFGVFERLHGRDEYAGTGIGLALCRKIAERHHGDITAEGVPGRGAKFTVRLPVAGQAELRDAFLATNGQAHVAA